MLNKMKSLGMLCFVLVLLTGCYGKDSKVTVYDTLAELKEKEHIEFHDFHDPLLYLLENKEVSLSEKNDLGITVPPENEDESCWFNLSKDEEELYVKFIRNGNPLDEGSKSEEINGQIIRYLIENDTTCHMEFQFNSTRYEIIAYEYQDTFTTDEVLQKLFEYIELETSTT